MEEEVIVPVSKQTMESSESKYHLLFEKAPIGITHFDRNGIITSCNNYLAEILGAPIGKIVGFNMKTGVRDAQAKAAVMEALSGRVGYFEGSYVSVTGKKPSWIKNIYTPFFSADGAPNGGICITENISTRHQAEKEIRSLARLPDENPNPIMRLAADGLILYGNMPADVILRHWHRQIGEKVPDHIRLELKTLLNTNERKEINLVCGERIFACLCAPVQENNYINLYCRDITFRKKIATTLELHSLLLDNTKDSVFLFDKKGRFLYLNQAAYQTRGYTKEELMSMSLADLNTPAYTKLLKRRIKKVMLAGSGLFESAHRRKDGSVMPIEVQTVRITIAGKECILTVARDISERKDAEKQIKEQSMSLEQKNAALREILEQITLEKNELKTRMHLTMNKLIIPKLAKLKSKSDQTVKDQLSIIENNIKNIDSSFGKKISSVQRSLSPREIEVCDMIRAGLKNKAIARGLRLSFDTVETMRKNIRRKLKLRNKDANLRTYLQTI